MAHPHSHDHPHDHAGHTHAHGEHGMLWPLLLTLGFAFVEAVGGWLSGSLALLGDAGHMFSDAAALSLAWLGAWIAAKPSSERHSYGLMRAEIIVALANGLLMLLVVVGIIYEAVQRISHPTPVQGGQVMLIAFVGLLVNLVVARLLHGHGGNMNQRAALLHVMGDLLGSAAALLAGVVIYFTGWLLIDPVLSILIAVLILASTFRLLREVLQVLMEGVPAHISIEDVSRTMADLPSVHEVHSVHIWSLSSEVTALSAHVVLEDIQDWHGVLTDIRQTLHEKFNINHVTLQPETIAALNMGEVKCWLTRKTG